MSKKKISIIVSLLALTGVSHGSAHSSFEEYDFSPEGNQSFEQNINFLFGSLAGYMVDNENFEAIDFKQREFCLKLLEIFRGNEIEIKKESIDSMIKRMKGIVDANAQETESFPKKEGNGENMTKSESKKIGEKIYKRADVAVQIESNILEHKVAETKSLLRGEQSELDASQYKEIKVEGNDFVAFETEVVPSEAEFMTIGEIIDAISKEGGILYLNPCDSIFDGLGKEELGIRLSCYLKKIEQSLKNEENLESLLEPISEVISSLDNIIAYANFELQDCSPEEIENHNEYYGFAKVWFEKVKNLVMTEIEERAN